MSALVSNILNRSQRNFAHVTTVTLSWRVQNFVVVGRVHFKLEHCKIWSNFEFDRNIVSGTGARNTTALALEKQYYSPSASGIKGITIWLYVLYIELYVYITRYHVWMKNCDVVATAVVEHDDYYVAGDDMMTSSNGNIFRVTGHLCGEFTGPRWIPHTKASDAELWCLLWSTPE